MPDASVPSPEQPTAAIDPRVRLRRGVYLLLIAISVGGMVGRTLAVNSVDVVRLEKYLADQGKPRQLQRPFLSSNDRSRWATVRALVEHGTYRIDDIISQPGWDTIDMVKHDGQGNEAPAAEDGYLYSSKPPLFPTMMAGEYWVIHKLTGWTLDERPYSIGRFMVITINVLPMMVYFLLLCRWVEWYGTSDWGRIFVIAAATLATLLSTFAVVINNHTMGAVSAMIALDAAARVWLQGDRRWRWFVVAGLFAAFTAANELPALTLVGLLSLALLWKAPKQTLLTYVPALAVVAAAFFGTNWLAHNTLVPPYAHRSEGDNWYDYQFLRGDDPKPKQSYWSDRLARSPVDQGEPLASVYALHALVGHHGIFSLTPVWLLSIVGLGIMLAGRPRAELRQVGLVILLASAVCLAFYLTRPIDDRNYGGMTSGFRWMFWFAPLWLIAMLPAADWMASRRWLQIVAAVLLALSVLSASYPTWNPWVHPWILDYLTHLEWVELGNR